MNLLGNDAALITYRTTVDGTCGGHKLPAHSWAASVYVGDGDKWRGVFHADAAGTMLSATVGILTFKGAADGTCFGQKVGPIWGSSVYVKDGNVWKWTFGINVPARRKGA